MTNFTETTLDLIKKAHANPSDDIAKAINLGTGLQAYDLQAPAKNLYPVVTPIRNVMPRVGGGTGTGSHWKQINTITGSGFDAMGWVPEGQRSGGMAYATSDQSSTFVTLGEEDSATFEAISAGRGFEDIMAGLTFRLLQKMMLKEEMAILGGNKTMLLGTPVTPTVSAVANTSSTLPTGTYKCYVVGLTLEGYHNSSLAGGVATTKSVTGMDGKSFTINGGSSALSAESAGQATVVSTSGLGMTTTAIQGAVAYAWYVSSAGGTGDETLQLITTTNWAVLSTTLAGSRQAATAVTADHSRNNGSGGTPPAYDGLLTAAFTAASGADIKIFDTGVVGTGTTLTASGRGSVVQIDDMFQRMWDNYQVTPSVLYVNSQELKNITLKVVGNGSAPLVRYSVNGENASSYDIGAGGVVRQYYNPFMISGGMMIPIMIHPKVPPGTILAWGQDLPVQYQSNHVPQVAQVRTRSDYYQIDWPITTRQREVGVYAEEVLEVYAPFALGVLCNIAPG